jgi:protoheme IX farnesyltransferase
MSSAMTEKGGAPAPLATSAPLSGVGDWLALLKPRVILLVVFTGLVGLLVAPGTLHPVLALTAILCIATGAGAAGALNMWYDRDIDARMRRTARRPIPGGRIEAPDALAYGVFLSVASVLILGLATNWVAAGWLAFSIFFYVVIYTMVLKRRTPQNIVIGGAAGAFPPVIGWAAVTGDTALLPWLMFAIIFAWTPPHFWALSLWTHGDYARVGVPMLPVTHGARATRWHVLAYTAALFPIGLSPWLLGFAGPVYGGSAIVLGGLFLWHATRTLREDQDASGGSLRQDAAAKRCFGYSIIYLFVLFGILAFDMLVSPR